MKSVPAYGVMQQTKVLTSDDVNAEELMLNGYTVIENCLDSEQLINVTSAYNQLVADAQKTDEVLSVDRHVYRCPLAENEEFLEVALLAKPLNLIARMLGDNFVLLMQNAVTSVRGEFHNQAQWHRDLNYQHFVSSQPIAFNFLLAVDDFNTNGGATMVLPGSHLFEDFPSDDYVMKFQKPIEAPAGAVIVMNAMTFHRTGDHLTGLPERRAVNHVIGRPFLAQQIDMPRYIHERSRRDYSKDAFLKKYLGYQWNPAENVFKWQRSRQ